jgi:hypothetical protein
MYHIGFTTGKRGAIAGVLALDLRSFPIIAAG